MDADWKFRDYSEDVEDPVKERVRRTYDLMHTNQTVEFVKGKRRDWLRLSREKMTVREALEKLNDLVDESDPDTQLPNLVHAFQTAERIRKEQPALDWLQLAGLVHDMGKVLALHGEPQWAVVGDTFPVGCRWSDSIVYGRKSFRDNLDRHVPKYADPCGIYEPGCGLDALLMSWGHDEYLYEVLRRHPGCRLPEEALYVIRFHSFYPYHTGGAYTQLANARDRKMYPWLILFNRYDLYTKSEEVPDIEALWPYYQRLIDKYLPGKLSF